MTNPYMVIMKQTDMAYLCIYMFPYYKFVLIKTLTRKNSVH